MDFLQHFKLVLKDFFREVKTFEYGQYFLVYSLVTVFLISLGKLKGWHIADKLQKNHYLLIMFFLMVTIILIFTIPNNGVKKSKWRNLEKNAFGFIEKFGSVVFTAQGIMLTYIMFIILNKHLWDKSFFILYIMLFMAVIKFFLSAIHVNQQYR